TLLDDQLRTSWRYHMVGLHQYVAVLVLDILTQIPAGDTLLQALDLLVAVQKRLHVHTRDLVTLLHAVALVDDQLLGYVYQTSGQVTRVGGTKGGIGKSFAGSVGGHEVLQYVQTLTEVGLDRQLDGPSGGIRHQSTHTRQLLDLLIRTTGSGVRHHIDIVIFLQTSQQCRSQAVVGCSPGRYYSVL